MERTKVKSPSSPESSTFTTFLDFLEPNTPWHFLNTVILGGELCATTADPIDFNARLRVYDLIHYCRNPQSKEDLERIGFKVFDLIELNGQNWLEKPFKERFDKLKSLFLNRGEQVWLSRR